MYSAVPDRGHEPNSVVADDLYYESISLFIFASFFFLEAFGLLVYVVMGKGRKRLISHRA
jgi:hypothetical protein